MLGGVWDDKVSLSPNRQFIFPLLASVIVVAAGIGISYITNPFSGVIDLVQWQWTVLQWQDVPYHLTLWADVFTVVWLLGTTYTTKLLDGVDGLVAGVLCIGGVIIFFLSISAQVAQPETGTLALIIAGAAFGFLLWNFSPAKIYLGEGGSLLAGFMLGVLAILSGGKIATALLILGLPIIDLLWVIIRRWFIEKRSPFLADTSHLHFQLRAAGLSERTIALLFYLITTLFGVSTLIVSGVAKLIVLVGLMTLAVLLIIWSYRRAKGQSA